MRPNQRDFSADLERIEPAAYAHNRRADADEQADRKNQRAVQHRRGTELLVQAHVADDDDGRLRDENEHPEREHDGVHVNDRG